MSNILYLPTRYYPAISGAEFYIQNMAEILTFKYKQTIDIFTSEGIDFRSLRDSKGKSITKNNKLYADVNKLRINRFSINYNLSLTEKIKMVETINQYKNLKITQKSLLEYIKNGPFSSDLIEYFQNNKNVKYDLIHTTFYPYFNLITSLIIGRILQKPVICTPFFHFSNPRYLNSDLLIALKKFDKIIACTNLEKRNLIKLLEIPETRIEVIPMGVDYNKFNYNIKNNKKGYNFKQNFFKNGEKKYKMVLFCGYKNYEKGAISILKAIPLITKRLNKVYFVFIGPSTMAFNRELSKIQKIYNIRILNFTPDNLTGYYDKKKIAAFKEADVYLMPSRSDAFGIAFLEAWASRKPVIGANIGATPEIIRNNFNGLLVEFDNPNEIADRVIYLLKRKRKRNKLGLQGQKIVIKNYSWEEVARKTNELYRKLI
ncbi:MAG: glycosyltransferase family 4 protein [Candidatus Hodarchaeota archaeon]